MRTELAKKRDISVQTAHAWRERFGALGAVDVRRLRRLEAEIERASWPRCANSPDRTPRYGHRRMKIFQARQGWTMSADRM